MSRHFRLSSELSAAIAKGLSHMPKISFLCPLRLLAMREWWALFVRQRQTAGAKGDNISKYVYPTVIIDFYFDA